MAKLTALALALAISLLISLSAQHASAFQLRIPRKALDKDLEAGSHEVTQYLQMRRLLGGRVGNKPPSPTGNPRTDWAKGGEPPSRPRSGGRYITYSALNRNRPADNVTRGCSSFDRCRLSP